MPSLPFVRTFANPLFRKILLLIAFVPSFAGYTYFILISRLIHPDGNLRDLQSYLIASQDMAHNMSPYLQLSLLNPDPTLYAGYAYPPLLAWLLIPIQTWDWKNIEVSVIVLSYVSLVLTISLSVRATNKGSLQNYLLASFLVMFFDPLLVNIFDKNVTIFLMAITAFWVYAFCKKDGFWGGIAIGLAIAVKMFEVSILAILVLLREKKQVLAALLTVLSLTLLAGVQYLPYLYFNVIAPDSGGSGYVENQSPAWLIARLFHHESIRGQHGVAPLDAKIIVDLVAIVSLLLTFYIISRRPLFSTRRPLIASAMIALMPMTWPYCLPQHMSLILPSMMIVIILGITYKKPKWILGMLLGFFLMSSGHSWFVHTVGAGFMPDWYLRIFGMLGPLGAVSVWVTSLYALRDFDKSASSEPLGIVQEA